MTPNSGHPEITPDRRLYRTADQGLAATLLALGFSLEGVEREPDGWVLFVFRWREGLEDTIAGYWTDQLVVNPRALVLSLHEVQVMTEAWASEGGEPDES